MKSPANSHAPAVRPPRGVRARLDRALRLVAGPLVEVESLVAGQIDAFDPDVRSYVSYATSGGGKRLRPALTLLAAGATGEVGRDHIRIAAVVELIHVATLVHDDVIDGAEVRRAHASVNARWGDSLSVLLGDCLFAHAMTLASEFPQRDVTRLLAQAVRTVCTGEMLQTRRRFDLGLTAAEYARIIEMKTGALFAVASELAALLNGVTGAAAGALREYGLKLGSAYQIYDDCVDLAGNERAAGKSLGTDVRKGKLTLPLIALLRLAPAPERPRLAEMFLRGTEADCGALRMLAADSGALREAIDSASRLLDEASSALAPLAPSRSRDALGELVGCLADMLAALVG